MVSPASWVPLVVVFALCLAATGVLATGDLPGLVTHLEFHPETDSISDSVQNDRYIKQKGNVHFAYKDFGGTSVGTVRVSGSKSYLYYNNDFSCGSKYTVSMWLRGPVTNPNSWYSVVRNYVGDNNYLIVLQHPGEMGAYEIWSDTFFSSGFNLIQTLNANDNWLHLAAVGTSHKTTFYINGTKVGGRINFASILSTKKLRILGCCNGETFEANAMYDFRVYEKAFSSSQVQQLFEMRAFPPTPAPTPVPAPTPDSTPPVVTCPSSWEMPTTHCAAQVNSSFLSSIYAVDNTDGPINSLAFSIDGVAVSDIQNYFFPLDRSVVRVEATDSTGNTGSCTFLVYVISPTLTKDLPSPSILFDNITDDQFHLGVSADSRYDKLQILFNENNPLNPCNYDSNASSPAWTVSQWLPDKDGCPYNKYGMEKGVVSMLSTCEFSKEGLPDSAGYQRYTRVVSIVTYQRRAVYPDNVTCIRPTLSGTGGKRSVSLLGEEHGNEEHNEEHGEEHGNEHNDKNHTDWDDVHNGNCTGSLVFVQVRITTFTLVVRFPLVLNVSTDNITVNGCDATGPSATCGGITTAGAITNQRLDVNVLPYKLTLDLLLTVSYPYELSFFDGSGTVDVGPLALNKTTRCVNTGTADCAQVLSLFSTIITPCAPDKTLNEVVRLTLNVTCRADYARQCNPPEKTLALKFTLTSSEYCPRINDIVLPVNLRTYTNVPIPTPDEWPPSQMSQTFLLGQNLYGQVSIADPSTAVLLQSCIIIKLVTQALTQVVVLDSYGGIEMPNVVVQNDVVLSSGIYARFQIPVDVNYIPIDVVSEVPQPASIKCTIQLAYVDFSAQKLSNSLLLSWHSSHYGRDMRRTIPWSNNFAVDTQADSKSVPLGAESLVTVQRKGFDDAAPASSQSGNKPWNTPSGVAALCGAAAVLVALFTYKFGYMRRVQQEELRSSSMMNISVEMQSMDTKGKGAPTPGELASSSSMQFKPMVDSDISKKHGKRRKKKKKKKRRLSQHDEPLGAQRLTPGAPTKAGVAEDAVSVGSVEDVEFSYSLTDIASAYDNSVNPPSSRRVMLVNSLRKTNLPEPNIADTSNVWALAAAYGTPSPSEADAPAPRAVDDLDAVVSVSQPGQSMANDSVLDVVGDYGVSVSSDTPTSWS